MIVRILLTAVLGLALTACATPERQGGSTDVPAKGAGTPIASPSVGSTFAVTPQPPKVVDVTLKDGKVQTADPELTVPVGRKVQIRLTADSAGRLSVVGVNGSAEVPAGGTGTMTFTPLKPADYRVVFNEPTCSSCSHQQQHVVVLHITAV